MNKKLLLVFFIALSGAAIFLAIRIINNSSSKNREPIIQKSVEDANLPGGKALLAVAEEARGSGDLIKAKEALRKFIERFPASDKTPGAQESLEDLNVKILFSSIATPDSFIYEVQKGDSLVKIAKKFNTTAELIAKSNNLKDTSVRIGQKLKLSRSKFSIVVDKSQNILTLKSGQDIMKTYMVSTGKNSCTPVGTFKIDNKIIDPPWYPPAGGVIQPGDPRNVLGSRWMGISKPSYGIHGTTQPESIGKSVTEGCVRMKNSDVEELYSIVPVGTEVVITD